MRYLITLVCALALFACGNKNQFTLEGNIKGVEKDKIVLGTFQGREMVGIDTAEVVNGTFRFERESLPTGSYVLRLLESKVSLGGIFENGNLTLSADIKNAERGYIPEITLQGGKNYDLADRFNNMQYEILKHEKYANAADIAAKIKKTKDHEEYVALKEKLNALAPKLEEEVKAAQLKLVKENVDQYFVTQVFWIVQQITSPEDVKAIYAQLPESSKKSERVVTVMEDIKAKERIQPGKTAPNFTLKTPEGEDLSLSDLKGKIVLVDFWASWCKPCRASFPHMKELYQKYHAKGFEVLGVTNDTNHKAWKKAIKDDGIPWLNVADEFPIQHSPAKVISEYGMDYLPSTVLIDREGIIIAKLLHGDELDQKLEELFGF
ncbi:TlpA disulfide reductase family protein [Marinifilum caeruleilacunae]|uniref:AhpC/TSA family protein n=1 Tax=Marinifilum caeruleilacunae TaxID=2499076 RepID=A0ABX1WTH2_9BACT|nr:TlpA disulfide reductase family protein [Marinifilum caeruleilacunae]NOU59301.1 AhpC/TSA family protein [Marinifilum caeruleilacunae]